MTTVVLPQIITEAAIAPGQPVSGPGTFTLDDPAFGLLDTDVLGGADLWADISQWVLNFTITQQFTRLAGPLLQFQTGTATITLDNSDGRFDPDNLSGPYVATGVSQIHAMVPVRIRAVFGNVAYPLFKGFANAWTETAVSYSAGWSEWTVSAADAFTILAGITLPAAAAAGSGEDTGARISRVLNSAMWYTGTGGGARFLDAGDSRLQATSYGDTALNLIQVAADSEIGQVYVDGSGAVVFRHRRALITDPRSVTSQATFGDNPSGTTELACAAISRADDDTTVFNDIQATITGSANLQEVTDATSQATYLFPRTYARSDLILQTDADAFAWASWVCYIAKNAEDRFDTVTVDPAADPANLWPQVLGRAMGDRITAIRRPPQGSSVVGTAISKDGFIAGKTHSFDVATSAWATTWTLADASKYAALFTLDDATLGQLDHNRIAY